MLIFLVRGKLVIDFYILPLLPLLAINIALLFHFLTEKLSFRNKRVYAILASFILLCLSLFVMLSSREYFYKNETEPQIQTIAWIKRNLPTDTTIVIDDSLYVDLHAYAHSESYHNAEWAWKIEKDPEIRMQTIANDWKNIEYITLSHEVLKQIRFDQFPLTKYALEHSIQVADFRTSSSSYRDIENYISTNGDWMSIRKDRNTGIRK